MHSMKPIFAVILAATLPLVSWAQSTTFSLPLPGLAATEWEVGYAKPVDGEALVSPDMWNRLMAYAKASNPATPAEERRYIGEAEATEMIRALRYDGKLDATEIDLLEELALPKTRAIHIQRKGDAKSRVAIQSISGLMMPSARELAAMWHTEWDKAAISSTNAGGWTVLMKADARGANSHEALRQRLVIAGRDHFARAVTDSNYANRFAPFREAITKIYTANSKLPAADQARGKRLLADAAEAADVYYGGKAPDFLYSWLRNDVKG